MNSRAQVYLFAFIFILLGASLTVYKQQVLGFPLTPGQLDTVWTIEAEVSFDADGDRSIKASLGLPDIAAGYELLSESFSSSGFGFDIVGTATDQRRALWTKRQGNGEQQLYYRLQIAAIQPLELPHLPPQGDDIYLPEWLHAERDVASNLVRRATELSADPASLARQILLLLNSDDVDADFLRRAYQHSSNAQLAQQLLAHAGQHARLTRGIMLEDDRRNLSPDTMLEVWSEDRWVAFDPTTANQGYPRNFLVWQRGDSSLFEVSGGSNSLVRFSMNSNRLSAKAVAMQSPNRLHAPLLDFSIFTLPVEKQNAFKSILLVPIGILLVAIFRILVGLRTSGTFMPVLIALAFIETNLATGLITFLTIVGVGLWLRSYLSRINLLLVARISVVVIMVIILMASFSVISYKLGLDEVLAITFFPMIIIAWTIERMSILWEEDGAKEVLIQGGGSLLVAMVAYLAMTNSYVTHLTFNFPEILLIEAGLILLLGQYSGYRLSEFYRFRFMGRSG
ncbi:UUP1 family membrane protein [Motiliproteus sediminis]|uniref:UUP1 family membrane protein n=1 Tax=Motiliproteus sediminis TaxID=1468178 RepID=UPI001AEFAA79|nr:UUP1 family membrane protein [Motiliproteus sediminis]